MGQTEFLITQAAGGMDLCSEHRDDNEPAFCRAGGVPESARFGWESAWIDLGGEG
jgi:hypothetical protein